jgi:hypothetical protein
MKALVPVIFCLFFLASEGMAQTGDTLITVPEKAPHDSSYSKRRANRAALFSAVVPGLGQVYNRKYWKPPILYAGLIALGYSIEFNNSNYKIFKRAYLYRTDPDSTTVDDYQNIYPDPNALLVRKDYYRRTRDLMWIIASGVYILNIIDAYVDAHLADFDVSDDLSFSAQPTLQFASAKVPVPSLAFTLRLK